MSSNIRKTKKEHRVIVDKLFSLNEKERMTTYIVSSNEKCGNFAFHMKTNAADALKAAKVFLIIGGIKIDIIKYVWMGVACNKTYRRNVAGLVKNNIMPISGQFIYDHMRWQSTRNIGVQIENEDIAAIDVMEHKRIVIDILPNIAAIVDEVNLGDMVSKITISYLGLCRIIEIAELMLLADGNYRIIVYTSEGFQKESRERAEDEFYFEIEFKTEQAAEDLIVNIFLQE